MTILTQQTVLLIGQTDTRLVDPTISTNKVTTTPGSGPTAGKRGLDVNCIGGCSGSSGGGVSEVTVDIRDGGVLRDELQSMDTKLGSIDAKNPALVGGRVPVDGSGVTQPVSLSSAVDVSDRAARLLGKADILIGAAAPSVSNYMPSRLTDGAAYYKAAVAGDNMGRSWTLSSGTDSVVISDGAGSITIDSTQFPNALVGGRFDVNVGSWLGSTAPTVGQKTMANSIPVVLPSDQTAIPVTASLNSGSNEIGKVNNPQVSSANNPGACVSVSTNTTVLASFATRRVFFLAADPTNTDDVFCKAGAVATSSSFRLSPGTPINDDSGATYTGQIDCLANSGTQKVCVMEL